MQHVSAPARFSASDGQVHLIDRAAFTKALAKLGLGDGEALIVRVEREAEAWRYSELKHYFGHYVAPVAEYTGYTKHEVHALLFKAQFMPEGRTSITELSREELRAFIEQVEVYVREEIPEATGHPMFAGAA